MGVRARHEFSRAMIAVMLAWVAGFVDAVGWLFVFHIYTSHMTGNTAAFGISAAQSNWRDGWRHAWPIVPFLFGGLFSAFSTAAARRKKIHSSFSIALAVEVALLLVFIFAERRHTSTDTLTSLLAAAMGVQTLTVTRVSGLRIYTTYLTGSLSKFSEAVVRYGFWFRDRTRGRMARRIGKVLRVTPRLDYAQHMLLTIGLWFGFFFGAFTGAMMRQAMGLDCMILPAAALVVAILVDLLRPVAAADDPQHWDDL